MKQKIQKLDFGPGVHFLIFVFLKGMVLPNLKFYTILELPSIDIVKKKSFVYNENI